MLKIFIDKISIKTFTGLTLLKNKNIFVVSFQFLFFIRIANRSRRKLLSIQDSSAHLRTSTVMDSCFQQIIWDIFTISVSIYIFYVIRIIVAYFITCIHSKFMYLLLFLIYRSFENILLLFMQRIAPINYILKKYGRMRNGKG